MDIGWTELLLIGIVALIVVGPKDLPILFRSLGQITGKARRMAREFQRAMEDAAKEAGVDEVSKDLKSMTSARKLGLDRLQDAAHSFDKWEPGAKKKPAGPATAELSAERAETARKVREATAARATARKEAEAATEAEADAGEAAAATPEPADVAADSEPSERREG